MFCPKCGTQNEDNAYRCVSCSEVLHPAAPQFTQTVSIPNYLVQSILVTIFCCLPLGIPAIVYAAQVNTKVGAGDLDGAAESSRKAKMWCWIAFGIGLVWGLIIGGVQIAAIVAAAAGGM